MTIYEIAILRESEKILRRHGRKFNRAGNDAHPAKVADNIDAIICEDEMTAQEKSA